MITSLDSCCRNDPSSKMKPIGACDEVTTLHPRATYSNPAGMVYVQAENTLVCNNTTLKWADSRLIPFDKVRHKKHHPLPPSPKPLSSALTEKVVQINHSTLTHLRGQM